MSGLLFVLARSFALALVAVSGWALGGMLVRSLSFSDSLERSVFAIAIGLGVLANLVHLLGLMGVIRPAVILALLAIPLAIASLRGARRTEPRLPPEGLDRGLLLALLLGLVPAAVLALYPPTAFDATLYHLPYAKAFSTQHGITFLPTLRFPVFPQLFEMLFTAALSISDDITAQLIHVLCLALTAAAIYVWGRRIATARAGVWAAAAWLGSPIVLDTGAAAYVDCGLALFATLCLYAWTNWRETGDPRWLGWSAAFAGFAASVKYHGLFFVFAVALAILIAGPRRGLRPALRYIVIAILVLSPFYGRIVAQTGNPLFPYFSGWFGPNAWSESIDPVSAARASPPWLDRLTHPEAVARVLDEAFLPANVRPRRAILSPLVALLPLLLATAAIEDRRRRALAGVLFAYLGCWYLLTPTARFLFPAIPACSVIAASFVDGVLRRREIPRRTREPVFAFGVALILVLPGAAFGWRKVWRQGPLPVTLEARESYLDERVVAHAALRALNSGLGTHYTVYCLRCESAAYFADGRFLGDHFGPYRFSRIQPALGDGLLLHARLQEMSVTHLVVNHERDGVALPDDPAFRDLFTPVPTLPGVSLFALEPVDNR